MSSVPASAWVDVLKALVVRLIADPKLFAKVKALWEAITAFFPAAPEAAPEATDFAESLCEGVDPEKLFQGGLIKLIAGIKSFIDTHPELIQTILSFLALIPKEPDTV